MGWRFSGIGLARRDLRDRKTTVASYRSLLGSLLIDMWHAQYGLALTGGEVDAWTGQASGIVLQASGASARPLYAQDGSYFKSKEVVQCMATGSKRVARNAGSPTILPSGSQPWLAMVARIRSATSSNGLASAEASVGDYQFSPYMTSPSVVQLHVSGASRANKVVGNGQAFYEFVVGSPCKIVVDGSATTGSNATLSAGCPRFALGGSIVGGCCDLSIALAFLCSSEPPASVVSAIRVLATQEFG